jgi:hypothetical protein
VIQDASAEARNATAAATSSGSPAEIRLRARFDLEGSLERMRLFVALALWTAAEGQGRLMPVGPLRRPAPSQRRTAAM